MAKLAFLGLGVMGAPMAGHLQKAGHDVTVYNRTAAKAEAWAKAQGGKMAATPREAAAGAAFVMSCVGNDDDLRGVCLGADGAFAGMAKGAVFVDHTTVSAAVTRELYAAAQDAGISFVDAPISGGQALPPIVNTATASSATPWPSAGSSSRSAASPQTPTTTLTTRPALQAASRREAGSAMAAAVAQTMTKART